MTLQMLNNIIELTTLESGTCGGEQEVCNHGTC